MLKSLTAELDIDGTAYRMYVTASGEDYHTVALAKVDELEKPPVVMLVAPLGTISDKLSEYARLALDHAQPK